MKNKKCLNCGEEIKKKDVFCQNCGHNNKKSKKNKTAIITFLLATMIYSTSFFLIYEFYLKDLTEEKHTIEEIVTVTDEGIADAVEKVYDSVVVVHTYSNEQLISTGSGFVYKIEDEYGYIITNAHVIEDGNNVKVILTNNKTIEATIVGQDSYSDIAVLRIDEEEVIEVAQLGSSESLRLGDTTFAVGAPLDSSVYSWTTTRGIISGIERLVEVGVDNSNVVMNVLQTDTAINSGNSGGPLCNSAGEVIGVTNMKLISPEDGVEGIGFAIPIEVALEYANSFVSGIPITRPYLGVATYDVNNFQKTGVIVDSVVESSAAEDAGIKKDDIILKVNDESVPTSAYLKYELYKYEVGDTIKITVLRDDTEVTLNVKLGTQNITS